MKSRTEERKGIGSMMNGENAAGAEKTKLLFIIWSFSYGGGAEKVLANVVNSLDPEKYEIDVLEYWHVNIKAEPVRPHVKLLPPVIDVERDSKLKKVAVKLLLENLPSLLRKKYLHKKYDVEIAFNYMIPTFFLTKKGKTVSWVHGDIYDLRENRRNRALQRRSFSHVDRIVAISKRTYGSILEVFPEFKEKVTVIHNSFPFDGIDALAEEGEEIPKPRFTFLFVGRFDANKNPVYLLEVANELKKRKRDFELWFLGQGEKQKEMEEKIEEYDLHDRVKIWGYRKNPYPFFKRADAVVLCSFSEGFPTVLAEGLHFGKPFISTDVGGTDELSDGGKCGFVAGSREEYTAYAMELMDNKELYHAASEWGKKNIDRFTGEKQIRSLEALLWELREQGEKT